MCPGVIVNDRVPPQLAAHCFQAIHGLWRTPTYNSWRAMKARCDYKHHTQYKYYGARGITYDPRWASFEAFLSDMGERPLGTDLNRIDPDKSYCMENCNWLDAAVNRRMSRGCR